LEIRALEESDRAWAATLLRERWGSPQIITREHLHRADRLPGYIGLDGDHRVGLVTFSLQGQECEIVSLDSRQEGRGIGSALLQAVVNLACSHGCNRVWLITTNDNWLALRFYQKRGFVLVALYRDALADARRLKPEIPLMGLEGIPLRDEIELERRCAAG